MTYLDLRTAQQLRLHITRENNHLNHKTSTSEIAQVRKGWWTLLKDFLQNEVVENTDKINILTTFNDPYHGRSVLSLAMEHHAPLSFVEYCHRLLGDSSDDENFTAVIKNSLDYDGRTCLHLAILHGAEDAVVSFLKQKGGDEIECRRDAYGFRADNVLQCNLEDYTY
uniref:Uncharacterized protein n=1 Tax=Ditylum brightwellii TaxID=49249 RepID=A0A6V2BSB2_9STRA